MSLACVARSASSLLSGSRLAHPWHKQTGEFTLSLTTPEKRFRGASRTYGVALIARGISAGRMGARASVATEGDAQPSTEESEVQFWDRIQTHQKTAAKLTPVEDARTTVDRCLRGMLSTFSKKNEGFPSGSMVGYASDDFGRPILAVSTLSPHTADLGVNPKCSLLVSRDPNRQSETLVAMWGEAVEVPEAENAKVRELYLKKHPDAFWVDFGDFRFVRIEPVKVRYTANIATFAQGASVAEFTSEEYLSARHDPISPFEKPIAAHMNADHEEATIAMVEHAIGVKVPSAKVMTVDRLGFKVEVKLMDQMSRIRLPFPRPAADRKGVKDLIVEMTKASKRGVKNTSDS